MREKILYLAVLILLVAFVFGLALNITNKAKASPPEVREVIAVSDSELGGLHIIDVKARKIIFYDLQWKAEDASDIRYVKRTETSF